VIVQQGEGFVSVHIVALAPRTYRCHGIAGAPERKGRHDLIRR
jgi:hypothetical protein